MLAMLMVATALTRVTSAHSLPSDERGLSKYLAKGIFSEDDMTPDFTEQLGHHDHGSDIKKRHQVEKYESPRPQHKTEVKNESPRSQHKTEVKNTTAISKSAVVRDPPEKNKKRLSQHTEDVDVVDREDHVTQYLADLLVNTDSEITSLQASEIEDEREREGFEFKEDPFFAFLTGLEKAHEVEGTWTQPADEDLENDDVPNLIADVIIK